MSGAAAAGLDDVDTSLRSISTAPPELGKVKVLVVDDHAPNLIALEAILEPLGQTVVRALSGEEALRRMLHEDFAVVLMDVQMPGIDGLETGSLIKARKQTRDVPIIYLTAIQKDQEQIFRGYEHGAVDYLLKPFHPDVLRAKVSVFVDLYRRGEQIKVQAAELRRREREAMIRDREKVLGEMLAREKAARLEAEMANRAKDEFLATVSHELRTPLTAILGWVGMLRRDKLDADKQSRALEVIERNARAQAQIVEDILDVSRITMGKLRLELRAFDLDSVLAGAAEAVRPAADAKGVTLSVRLDVAFRNFFGDPDRVQQIVWNLLMNAVKFTPSGGSAHLRLSREGHDAVITVSDDGKGIDADALPHIFERFRQADGSSRRRHGGLGLGLALVRHLVELHGGTVSGESAGNGAGALFTVKLPVREAPPDSPRGPHAPGTTGPTAPPAGRVTLEQVRVLVVDDDDDTREVVTAALERHGALVSAAASAGEALEVLARVRPDVVLSDLGMPEQDGYALLRCIRALPLGRGRQTRVVALTAYASSKDRQAALEAGFDAHVSKPVDDQKLALAVSAVRERREPG